MNRDPAFDDQVIAALPTLRGQAMKLCRDATKAEDLVSLVVVKALSKHEQFKPGTNLKAWLAIIMQNEHYSIWRKRRREVEDADGKIAAAVPIDEGQSWAVDLKVIRKRMRMLNPLQRRCVEKVAILGMQMDEVAVEEGVAEGTIKSSLSRARDFLETGVVPVEPEPEPEPQVDGATLIESLYRAGKSVAEIVAEIGGIKRSDVMRVVLERKLPPRAK